MQRSKPKRGPSYKPGDIIVGFFCVWQVMQVFAKPATVYVLANTRTGRLYELKPYKGMEKLS